MKTIEEKRVEQREKHVLHIMKTCVHFTGIQHESCKAGLNYSEQFGSENGCFANIACTQAYPRDDYPIKRCSSVEYPTREKAEAEEAENEERNKRHIQIMREVHEDAKEKGLGVGHGGVSHYPCSLCNPDKKDDGGMVRYSVASVNGHIWGACTNGCVSWME